MGRGRGTRRRRARPHRSWSRHQRDARFRIHAVVLRRARGSHRRGARASRGGRQCERDVAAPRERARTAPPAYKPVGKGTSPLLLAVQNGHFELAIALVDAGADPNDRRTGFTPLHTITWVRKPDSSDVSDPAADRIGPADEPSIRSRAREAGRERQSASGQGRAEVPNTSSRIGTRGGDAISPRRRSRGRSVDAAAPGVGRRSAAAELRQHARR